MVLAGGVRSFSLGRDEGTPGCTTGSREVAAVSLTPGSSTILGVAARGVSTGLRLRGDGRDS